MSLRQRKPIYQRLLRIAKRKKPLEGRGNIGKRFHERADSFTHTNAKKRSDE